MELKNFAEELKGRMEADIDAISADQPDALRRTSLLIECVGQYASELKRHVVKYKFQSIKEEIVFFKHLKPEFISRLLYFRRLFKVQLFEMASPNERRLTFYRKELRRIQHYLARHQEFYQYVLSGVGKNDEMYFTRKGASAKTLPFDERFLTRHDHTLSKIRGMEMMRSYILAGVQKMENSGPDQAASALTWTGAKTDLVELIYALQSAGVFNNKEADVKQIATHFENAFDVTLGNYYRVFQDIRMRKTNQLKFLDMLREGILRRIKDVDDMNFELRVRST